MKRLLFAVTILLPLFLAACSSVPAPVTRPEAVAAVPGLTTRERIQRVVQLLDQAEEKGALAEIEAVLAENPSNTLAANLRKQVQANPQDMLGASYRTYTVLPGDTISSLAQTYLGDAMLFYVLSRYNELPAPNRLMVGQSLKLPDKYAGAPKNAVAAQSSSKPVMAAAKASAQEIESARSLRLEALEHLNKGNADQAVKLLEKAVRLDADNQTISEDLARAQRIQRTLRETN
jgi:Tfp pilus assembly protein PilF